MLRAAVLVLAACSAGAPKVTEGLHYELTARLDQLASELRGDIAADLMAALVAPGIARDVRLHDDLVVVKPSDDPSRVTALVRRDYPQLEEVACPDLCFRLGAVWSKQQENAAIAQTVTIVRARLRQTVRRADVTATAQGITIDVQTPTQDENDAIKHFVARRVRIELRPVDHDAPFVHELANNLDPGITVDTERWHAMGHDEEDLFLVGERKALERFLAEHPPPADREFGFEQRANDWRTYYLKRGMRIGAVKNATSERFERPAVTVELDDASAAQLEKLSTANLGKKLAIVLDGVVVSAPILSGKISASFAITLGDGADDADLLARLLRTGFLPVELREDTVSEIKR